DGSAARCGRDHVRANYCGAQAKTSPQPLRLRSAKGARDSLAGYSARGDAPGSRADDIAGARTRTAEPQRSCRDFLKPARRGGRRIAVKRRAALMLDSCTADSAGLPSMARRARRSRGLFLGQHAVELDAQVEELGTQMVEARLQIAHVLFRRDVDEVEHGLDVAVERCLVAHELLARLAQSAAKPLIAHHLVEHVGNPLFAHLAKLAKDALDVTACHDGHYYIEYRESGKTMETLASILSLTSGFALMGYRLPPATILAT